MRDLILAHLRTAFDEGVADSCPITNPADDDITDFAVEVEALNDEELLKLFIWTVGFQG